MAMTPAASQKVLRRFGDGSTFSVLLDVAIAFGHRGDFAKVPRQRRLQRDIPVFLRGIGIALGIEHA